MNFENIVIHKGSIVYSITECNWCEFYDCSYFDNSPQRYCRERKAVIVEPLKTLEVPVHCVSFSRLKKGRAKYVEPGVYKARYMKGKINEQENERK